MPGVRHSTRARADLLDIWQIIAADNPAAADRIFDRLEERTRILIDWPYAGVACPAIAPSARMLVERPYLILYRIIPGAVEIVRVLHGKRDVDAGLFMEGID